MSSSKNAPQQGIQQWRMRLQPWMPFILYFFAFLAPAWTCRLSLLREYKLGLYDSFGLISDVAAAALCTCVVFFVPERLRRSFVFVSLCVYCILLYANFEVIGVLDGNLDLRYLTYAFHPTFIRGSLFAIRAPFVLLSAILLALLLWYFAGRIPKTSLSFLAKLVAATYCLCVVVLSLKIETQIIVPRWRQYSLLLDFLQPTIAPKLGAVVKRDENTAFSQQMLGTTPQAKSQAAEIMRVEKGAHSFLPEMTRSKHNVILLIVEGLSGGLLEDPVFINGRHYSEAMPNLRTIANNNLYIKNGIAGNRGTVRGLFGLFCGRYPNLVQQSAKFFNYEATTIRSLDCLPEALSKEGYATHYLQAALLTFMSKHKYLQWIGFDTSSGAESFQQAAAWGRWGIDDMTLLQEAATRAKKYAEHDAPFFLSVLTVGTHHPYFTPGNFNSNFPRGTKINAAAYFDKALGEFYQDLEKSGLLENTLVIVTADEGMKAGWPDQAQESISGAWIPIVAFGADIPKVSRVEPFSQNDVPISILDYLKIKPPSGYIGRSIFDSYEVGRYLPFAYDPDHTIFMLTPQQHLLSCARSFTACTTYQHGEDLFSDTLTKTATNSETALNWLKALTSMNDTEFNRKSYAIETGFLDPGNYTIANRGPLPTTLFNKYLRRRSNNEVFSVQNEIEILKGGVVVHFEVHDLSTGALLASLKSDSLEQGQKIALDFSLRTEGNQKYLRLQFTAFNTRPTSSARLRITGPGLHSLGVDKGRPGVLTQSLEKLPTSPSTTDSDEPGTT